MTPAERRALRHIAPNVIWFETPEDGMSDETRFLTYVLAYGRLSDIRTVRQVIGDTRIAKALDFASPGVLAPCQWDFWNRFYGRIPVPAPPVRRIPGVTTEARSSLSFFPS